MIYPKISKLWMALILLPIFLIACNDNDNPEYGQKDIVLSRGEELANDGINDFGIRFFKQLAEVMNPNEPANFAVSPVSAALSMSMVANATDAARTSEILSLLGCIDLDDLNNLASKLTSYLPEDGEKCKLYLSNSVWYQSKLTLKEVFNTRMRNSYKASVLSLDFADLSAADEINNWCYRQTKGMIEKVVTADELNQTMAFLANALYFKDDWEKPFETENTKPDIFHGIKGDETVSMMNQTTLLKYYGTEVCDAVSLPYVNDYEFMAILPAKNVQINEFVKSFSCDDYNEICKQLSAYTVVLKLPKFKYSILTEASEAIKRMGVDLDKIRLSGMLENVNDIECEIKVKDAASIELDEKGTKVAVVTTWNGMLTSPGFEGNGIVKIDFDRPFIYFIRNTKTGSIIFAGQYVNG